MKHTISDFEIAIGRWFGTLDHTRPHLYVLTGIAGSGKTTVSKELRDLHALVRPKPRPAYVISSDEVWASLCPEGYDKEVAFLGYGIMHDLISAFLMQGFSVVFDSTALTPRHRELPLKAGNGWAADNSWFTKGPFTHKPSGVELCSLYFEPDVQTCIERRRATIPAKVIQGQAERWTRPSPEEKHHERGFDRIFNLTTLEEEKP